MDSLPCEDVWLTDFQVAYHTVQISVFFWREEPLFNNMFLHIQKWQKVTYNDLYLFKELKLYIVIMKNSAYLCFLKDVSFSSHFIVVLFIYILWSHSWLFLLVEFRTIFFFLSRHNKDSSRKMKTEKQFSGSVLFSHYSRCLVERFVSRLNFLPCYAVFVSS